MKFNLKNRPKEYESNEDDLTYYELLWKDALLWFECFEAELRKMLKNPKWTNNGDLTIKEILGE